MTTSYFAIHPGVKDNSGRYIVLLRSSIHSIALRTNYRLPDDAHSYKKLADLNKMFFDLSNDDIARLLKDTEANASARNARSAKLLNFGEQEDHRG